MSSSLASQRGLQSLHAKIKLRRQLRTSQAGVKIAIPTEQTSESSSAIGEAVQSAYAAVAGNVISLFQRIEDYRAGLSSDATTRR